MKKLLIDTNVVLDVLLNREPHVRASAAVWAAVESGLAKGFLAAHSVTTIHYLISRERGSARAKHIVAAILRVFAVAAVDEAAIRDALETPAADFEDAVSASAAQLAGCDLIVTRDPRGFRGSLVPAFTPEAAVHTIAKA